MLGIHRSKPGRYSKPIAKRLNMKAMHPISELAERLGRITNGFEPGTPLYDEFVEDARRQVDHAGTRDDLEQIVQRLGSKLTAHLTDDQLNELEKVIAEIESSKGPWPVEAFKEGYKKGTGEELPDEGSVAGRMIDRDRN